MVIVCTNSCRCNLHLANIDKKGVDHSCVIVMDVKVCAVSECFFCPFSFPEQTTQEMLNMTIKSSAAIWKEASKAIKGYTYAVVGSPSPIVSHIYTLKSDSLPTLGLRLPSQSLL